MTYDLTVWPVDRAMTRGEALVDLDARRESGFRLGLGHDRRLDPFIAEMERRYPRLRDPGPTGPAIEFDVHRAWIFLGVGWDLAEEVAAAVGDVAFRTGLAVYDPQREVVAMPAPFADAPLTADGVAAHVAVADGMLGALERGVANAGSETEATANAHAELRRLGGKLVSPLGFEITPDIEAEVLADPTRVPTSLQTAARKAELLAAIGHERVGERHRALSMLAGWDPDPEVARALRPIVASDDVFEASTAATGLARQGDLTDLPALVELAHRFSPADGGTVDAMILPLRAALELAEQAGPEIVEGLKQRGRTWRHAPNRRRNAADRESDAVLDELLGAEPAP